MNILGKLSWADIPFNQPIPFFTSLIVIAVIVLVLAYIALKGWIPYLWREWITSVDHKRIGMMYVILASVMLLRAFIDALMMRTQQDFAFRSEGYLPPEHYDQIFSAHGTIMIFFVAMPFMIGLMNFVVPLQLGRARRRLPDAQFGQPLADRDRRPAGQSVAVHRRVRPHRLAAVPAALGARPIRPASGSTITSGRSRSPASGRC